MKQQFESFNPTSVLKKIQKKKYTAAIIPIAAVFIGFILNSYLNLDIAKYLSLAGLVGYVLVLGLYRINLANPDNDDEIILSPINGKVIDIHDGKIIIRKHWLQSSDIRLGSREDNFFLKNIKGKIHYLTDLSPKQGELIGVAPGLVIVEVSIPDQFKIIVEQGAAIEAGTTVLANFFS